MAAEAQPLSFHHVNTSDGLSENNVRSVVIDKKGFLWIGTPDGLNVYDGYHVTTFKRETQPAIASNDVIHLTCDSRNRIWLGTPEGITWIDENRRFHRVVLQDTITKFGSRTIQDTKLYGPVIYTSLGQFYMDEKTQKWVKIDWIPKFLEYPRFRDAEPFDDNQILYATDSLVMLVDYANKRISFEMPMTAVFSLCRYSDHEFATGQQHGQVQIIDIRSGHIVTQYQLTSELNRRKINSTIGEIRMAANGSLLVGTDFAGLMIVDRKGNVYNYSHDPINTGSLGSNFVYRVLGGDNGDIIVGSTNAGVSIVNIYNKQAGSVRIFNDDQGHFYDSYVAHMIEDKNGIIWIGALERLIRWDKTNNKVKFFYYYSPPINTGSQNFEIRALCIDRQDRVWISALGDGISILDKTTGQFKKITRDTSLSSAVKNDYIYALYTAGDGTIWVGTASGIYAINSATLKIDPLTNTLLRQLAGTRVNSFREDEQGNLWMATFNGLYKYNKQSNRLDNFTTKDGLSSNSCYTLMFDNKGNLYSGTLNGFNIVSPEGGIRAYDRSKGLKYDYCEGTMQDDNGAIWIANTKCIIKFDPAKDSMQYFDANSGFTTEGFRMGSYLKSSTGELLWGSRSGINYYFPGQLINHPADIKVNIYQADMTDSTQYLGNINTISLPYSDNNIIFRFAAINLRGSHNVQYQYILEGHDKTWQNGTDIGQARYSSLAAGGYVFKLKASLDGVNWINASNEVKLTVVPPLWQQWWFIGIVLAVITGSIYWLISSRNKKIEEQREEIETEQAISYFASSLSEQQTEDAILWDVAKNCIGRLQFEDCVIYLLDEEKDELVQIAAHGPKSPREFEITEPLGIPIGKGIVGSVAFSGKAEIVNDTTKDPRYIVDDERRYSEITVPIIYDGKVLGVIDCEHSKKRFFTQKHLSILTTIASLCANKIIRARAEEEKKKAQNILTSTQQKMTEVEMQALRAQMNPHFIFNCLNSINRYIVKSDQTTASLYLTKFAKLIRRILDNSNSKTVVLTNELEALKLYIEMEALRFDKKFTYEIKIETSFSTDSVQVPPLIIQPYVENAIWHGLLHKEQNGHLSIRVSMISDTMLQCIIEDNGIGREKAKELKSKTATSRKSLGMQLTENRLGLLNKHAELNASVEIIDLEQNTEAAGTKVILKIPV